MSACIHVNRGARFARSRGETETPAGDDDSAHIRPKPPRRQRLLAARALTIAPDSHPIHWSRRVGPGLAWASILTHIDI